MDMGYGWSPSVTAHHAAAKDVIIIIIIIAVPGLGVMAAICILLSHGLELALELNLVLQNLVLRPRSLCVSTVHIGVRFIRRHIGGARQHLSCFVIYILQIRALFIHCALCSQRCSLCQSSLINRDCIRTLQLCVLPMVENPDWKLGC